MLFKVGQGSVRADNPEIDAIKEFSVLTDRQLKYIFLVYDYSTPLRQLSLKDRQEQAAEIAGYKRESVKRMDKNARDIIGGRVASVQAAIPVFKALQRDLDKETLMAFEAQLEEFIAKTSEKKEDNKDWDIALKISAQLPNLLKMRKDIKEKLDLRADFSSDDDAGVESTELSTLDKINQEKIESRGK